MDTEPVRSGASRDSSGEAEQAREGRAASAQRRPSWLRTDFLILGAVGLLVVLVSLPRLSVFAMHENETDALALVRTLAELPLREGAQPPLCVSDIDLAAVQRQRPLRDLEVVEEGERFLRYGYLFDLVQQGEQRVLRAWPARFGRTGRRVFVHTSQPAQREPGQITEHANSEGHWSGPAAPPQGPFVADGGWRQVPRDADYR